MTDKPPIEPITHSDERLSIPAPERAPMMDPEDNHHPLASHAV